MLSGVEPHRPGRGGGQLLHGYRRLAGQQARAWILRTLPVCSSTETHLSRWLQTQPQFSCPRAVIASRQRQGVGQRGRRWLSPAGGLWISAALPWSGAGVGRVGLLGLAVAVAIAQRLESKGLPVRVKWPNDLMIGDRKLAGLLPGVVQRGTTVRLMRVGVGLNVRNRVPEGGVSLHYLPGQRAADPLQWGREVLLALDRCMDAGGDGSWCLPDLERLLWADRIRNPRDGRIWRITGLGPDGALEVQDGASCETWRRWP